MDEVKIEKLYKRYVITNRIISASALLLAGVIGAVIEHLIQHCK